MWFVHDRFFTCPGGHLSGTICSTSSVLLYSSSFLWMELWHGETYILLVLFNCIPKYVMTWILCECLDNWGSVCLILGQFSSRSDFPRVPCCGFVFDDLDDTTRTFSTSHTGASSTRLLYRGENFDLVRHLETASCKRGTASLWRLERVEHAQISKLYNQFTIINKR